jgi:hypothetical protein
MNVSPPRASRTDKFRELIAAIQSLPFPFRTDCALALLDTSGEFGEQIIEMIARAKVRCVEGAEIANSSISADSPGWGLSFVAVPMNVAISVSADRVMTYSAIKKHQLRIEKWVALGWRQGSDRIVDFAFWFPYPHEEDPAMDAAVAKMESQSG